jgi:hypothetical protein
MIGESVPTPAPGPDPEPAEPVAPPPGQAMVVAPAEEFGGREGPDPTRYGDWEKNGRCIDF